VITLPRPSRSRKPVAWAGAWVTGLAVVLASCGMTAPASRISAGGTPCPAADGQPIRATGAEGQTLRLAGVPAGWRLTDGAEADPGQGSRTRRPGFPTARQHAVPMAEIAAADIERWSLETRSAFAPDAGPHPSRSPAPSSGRATRSTEPGCSRPPVPLGRSAPPHQSHLQFLLLSFETAGHGGGSERSRSGANAAVCDQTAACGKTRTWSSAPTCWRCWGGQPTKTERS
jgi:hypothetical protein